MDKTNKIGGGIQLKAENYFKAWKPDNGIKKGSNEVKIDLKQGATSKIGERQLEIDLLRSKLQIKAQRSDDNPPKCDDDNPSIGDLEAELNETNNEISKLQELARVFPEGAEHLNSEINKLRFQKLITEGHLAALRSNDTDAINFYEARLRTNETGDPAEMDAGDAFRASLDPAEQIIYDEQLEELRNNPDIEFVFEPGTVDDLATREIALRGMVAATFGRPQDLERTIEMVADQYGSFTITFTPGWGGATAPEPGITASQQSTVSWTAQGDNLFIHEFSHSVQRTAGKGLGDYEFAPPDMNETEFGRLYETSGVQQLLDDRGLIIDDPNTKRNERRTFNGESFATIQNLFRQDPQALRDASPEMYDLMVEYSGFDPLSGELTTKGKVNYFLDDWF